MGRGEALQASFKLHKAAKYLNLEYELHGKDYGAAIDLLQKLSRDVLVEGGVIVAQGPCQSLSFHRHEARFDHIRRRRPDTRQ